MPIYFYSCGECGNQFKRLLPKEEKTSVCKVCGSAAQRAPQPPTTRITETLDNGVMVRKVERLADAEQIHRERAKGKKGTI